MNRPSAVFWDMDGTMLDTEPIWGIATFELSENLGRRLTDELREKTVGGSFRNTLSICAEWAGVELQPGDYERYKAWMYERMFELLSGPLEPNPGVRELLASLHDDGVPMFVTTNTERVLADKCIDAVGREFFTGSVTGDEVTAPKPDPEMYLRAASMAGAEPHECLVFEDSWTGMSAAATAGCKVLGLAAEVPEGVVRFDPSRFVGATASDVYSWFGSMH